MAIELLNTAKSANKEIWKNGGRPSTETLIHCFTLCKDNSMLTVDEIEMLEFQRCLIYFTSEIFKYKPQAKYDVLPFEDKLDLVLEWAEKLDAKKKMRKVGGTMTIKSNAYQHMDQTREKANLMSTPDTPKDGTLFFNNRASMVHYHTMSAPEAYAHSNAGSRWGDSTDDEHSSVNAGYTSHSRRSSLGSWGHDEIVDVAVERLKYKKTV